MQTYAEYLLTMRAYRFAPLPESVWQDWQIFYHGSFKK
jgi:hypothetical protein